jgi:hypothetical protein
MNPEAHERAGRLIDACNVEGISAPEHAWLEAHLAECAVCRDRAHANERALQALRSNSVVVDPSLVRTTKARVRLRAGELRENQARLRALWISCGLSWVLGTLTAPLLWQALGWLGRNFEMSQVVRVTLLAFCWFAPASVVGAIVAWRQARVSGRGNEPEAWGR